MCLIIYKPVKVPFNLDHIENAMTFNSDGMSISIRTKQGIEVMKGIDMEFLESNFDYLTDREAVLHLRYGTSGAKTVNQCHPFLIGKRTTKTKFVLSKDEQVLFHNGIMFNPGLDLGFSDTQIMARGMRDIKELDYYTKWNKFLVQDNRKTLFLGNWFEVDNMLYSNLSYHLEKYTSKWSNWENWENEYYNYGSYQQKVEPIEEEKGIKCPVCDSRNTYEVSEWNETHECDDCHALFDTTGNVILNKWYA